MGDESNLIALFRAGRVPRYDETADEVFLSENGAKQTALWSAIRQALADAAHHAFALEIRYTADPQTQRVGLEIALWKFLPLDPSEDKNLIDLLVSMLPDDYEWRRTGPDGIAAASLKAPGSAGWRVSRLLRRIDFLDLPGGNPFDAETVLGTSRREIEQEANDYLGRRRLPSASITARDIGLDPYCVAVPAALAAEERSLRRVLGQAQRLAPTIISYTLAPVDLSLLKVFRTLFAHWHMLVGAVRSDDRTAADPSRPLQGLRPQPSLLANAFDRFMGPQSALCHLTIRVAAASREASTAAAQHVAAQFGGMKSFEVLTYSQGMPLSVLSDPWVEVPTADWSASDWEDARKDVQRQLDRQWVDGWDISDAHYRMLSWLPHLYTGDEAAAVLQLPRASSDGLPGLETRPPPPFVGSVERPCPVVDLATKCIAPPPPHEVRIGIARPGGGLAADVESDGVGPGKEMSDRYRNAHWHTVDVNSLTKHAFIVGSTGSGKTMSTLFLLRELARLRKPFMVIEPVKTEYSDALGPFERAFDYGAAGDSITRLRFEGGPDGGRAADFLPFDPMRIPLGVSVARHASYLKACFEAAFPLEPLPALLLEAGIRSYYTTEPYINNHGTGKRDYTRGCGFKLFSLGGPRLSFDRTHPKTGETIYSPSLRGFRQHFIQYFLPRAFVAKSGGKAQAELLESFQQIFERRFDNLWGGLVGEAARCAEDLYRADPHSYETLLPYLERPAIIELDGIPDADQKALMMAFLLTYLFERRQADDFLRRNPSALGGSLPRDRGRTEGIGLKHVLIIEEAHRILAPAGGSRGESVGLSSRAKAVSLFVDMLAEIRALGQGLVIVEQIPTKIIPEAVKNTNLKIMLRLTSKDDRDYLGEAMNFTEQQKRFVTSLRARPAHGIDMVVFEEGVDQPLMLSLPLPAQRPLEPWLYNEFFSD